MAAADVQAPPAEAAPAVPDYLADPNAVLGDKDAKWRYGRAPDYSKTRKVWAETKQANHEAGSLPQLVENLVKNWEVEASFKPNLADWRTIDHENYTFAINGGPPQSAEHMLKVGTYNAIIAPNEYYSPENSDFASSHKTFKRMMPTFAWEVLEVYSGPPQVAFKWRHWGTMKNDYVGFNDKGEKVTAKAHGGPIDIVGVTIATVDDKVRLQKVDTYFDPLDMFRQIAPNGIVNKEIVDKKIDKSVALDQNTANDGVKIAEQHTKPPHSNDAPPDTISSLPTTADAKDKADEAISQTEKSEDHEEPAETFHEANEAPSHPAGSAQQIVESAASQGPHLTTEHTSPNSGAVCPATGRSRNSSQSSSSAWERLSHSDARATSPSPIPTSHQSSSVSGAVEQFANLGLTGAHEDYSKQANARDSVDEHLEQDAKEVHPHPKTMEEKVQPEAGEAVAAAPQSEETRMTFEEMSRIAPSECPFLMNRE